MIPWQQFEQGAVYWDLAPRVTLHEEYLPYVEHGPSMAEVIFESPMLELAHERQFVVTQQGGDSAEFPAEHTRRIDDCLVNLSRHFVAHAGDDQVRAETPPSVDHVGLWLLETHCPKVNPVDLVIATASTTQAHPPRESPRRPSATSVSPRSDIQAALSPVTMLNGAEDRELSDGSEDQVVRTFLANQSHRSGRTLTHGAARAQKPIRQRRRGQTRGVLGAKAYAQLCNARSSFYTKYEEPFHAANYSCYPV